MRPQEAARDDGRDRGHLLLAGQVQRSAAGDQVRWGRGGSAVEGRGVIDGSDVLPLSLSLSIYLSIYHCKGGG